MASRLLISALVVVGLALPGCGGGDTAPASVRGIEAARTLRAHGFSVRLPAGWYGDVRARETNTAPLLRVATFPLERSAVVDLGQREQTEIAERDVIVTVVDYGPLPGRSGPAVSLPITIDRSDVTSFEGFREPVATRSFVARGRAIQLWAVFGEGDPGARSLARANEVLRTLSFTARRLELEGLGLELPEGWDGFAKQLGPDGANRAVYAANVPWPDSGQERGDAVTRAAFERLPADGIVIVASSGVGADPGRELSLPIELADGTFLAGGYEGQPAAAVSTQLIVGRVGERFLNVQVYFGRNDPSESMRAEADAVLATLRLE